MKIESYRKGKDMQSSNGFALAPAKQLQEMRFFTSIPILFFRPEIQIATRKG
jgi:hypothetical protein